MLSFGTSKIVEKEYYSNCCDAPPYNWDEVDACSDNTGCCSYCGVGCAFYIGGCDEVS